MDATYEIFDKRTSEKLVGFHDTMRIYDFSATETPCRMLLTMGEAVRVLDRIAANTGRKVGCREV